ncbi:tetratricopeptide repeat protein [Erythrobacter neustonensis]|nr:tetratricopeptide repeat protein [Erythrobacter neustonensis]
MTIRPRTLSLRLAGAAMMVATAASVASVPAPLMAQDNAAEARLKKVEAEVRALQRKVFPGGDGKFFEPQITPGTQTPATAGTTSPAPSTTAVTDILIRIDALENQLQTMTARAEEQANAIAQLSGRLAALEAAASAPAGTLAPAGALPQPALGVPAASVPASQIPAPRPAASVPAVSTAPAPVVSAPSAARLAAVQAIAKPQTADAADDEYSYGFRLWNAGFYPEARQQLTRYVEQYPNHSRISFGRNLLGRAFLDDNMPEDAARWFLKNYQANKAGDRAPDSLLYLGASMVAMKDTKRACIALAEFAETYPLIASGRLASDYQATRAKVKCN